LWVGIIELSRGFWPDQEIKNLHGNETVQLNLKVLKFLALNAHLLVFFNKATQKRRTFPVAVTNSL